MKSFPSALVVAGILLIVVLSQTVGGPYQLRVTPELIEESLTSNVTLECANPQDAPSSVKMIANVQVLKRQTGEGSAWVTLAEIREHETTVRTNDNNILVQGSIGNRTFLRIVWPVAIDSTFGQYRCDVVGYDTDYRSLVEQSNVVTLVRHNITAREVLNLLTRETELDRQEMSRAIQEQSERFAATVELLNASVSLNIQLMDQINWISLTLEEFQKSINDSIDQIQNYVDVRISSITDNVARVVQDLATMSGRHSSAPSAAITTAAKTRPSTTTLPTLSPVRTSNCRNRTLQGGTFGIFWPEGTFGLLMPDSGCPLDSECTEWQTSFYKFDTETDHNHNQVSDPSHLSTPVQETGELNKIFLTQRFCEVALNFPNQPWPNGTYCINRGVRSCPPGFGEGWIHFDEEDTNHTSSIVGGEPLYRSEIGDIYYCCRADGSASVPLVLPTQKPFYLYRYRGSCQLVQNMAVREEFLLVDTENEFNRDNTDKENYHPDATLNDVNITLCYYHT